MAQNAIKDRLMATNTEYDPTPDAGGLTEMMSKTAEENGRIAIGLIVRKIGIRE